MKYDLRVMTNPYETLSFDWLMEGNPQQVAMTISESGIVRGKIPFPPKIGSGEFIKIDLDIGISIFQAHHEFLPESAGRIIDLAEVNATSPEGSVQVQTVRGGRILHKENHPQTSLVFSDGYDLFRRCDKIQCTPSLDTTTNTVMTSFSVSEDVLATLVGTDKIERLFERMGLQTSPAITVLPVPLHVSRHLQQAINRSYTGPLQNLHCQARILDYLTSLITVFDKDTTPPVVPDNARERSKAVYHKLTHMDGKLPSLKELALEFGRSARLLNEDFEEEYGAPIFAFMRKQRLEEAHSALVESDISIKVLSERQGYSHVNHFSTAFRNLFGYAPGTLRKK